MKVKDPDKPFQFTDGEIISAFSNGMGPDDHIPTHQPHAPLLTNEQIIWVVRRFIAGSRFTLSATRESVLEEAAKICDQMRPVNTTPPTHAMTVQRDTLDNAARLIRSLK